MTNEVYKELPTPYAELNVQIKIIMKYPFHTFRMANIRMVDIGTAFLESKLTKHREM